MTLRVLDRIRSIRAVRGSWHPHVVTKLQYHSDVTGQDTRFKGTRAQRPSGTIVETS